MMSRSSQSILVIVPDNHEYKVPQRAVKTPADMQLWEKSEAYAEYVGFILAINEAIKGKSNTMDCHISEITRNMLKLLDQLDKLVDDVKPVQQPQRFGNQAFRTWYNILKEVYGPYLVKRHNSESEFASFVLLTKKVQSFIASKCRKTSAHSL